MTGRLLYLLRPQHKNITTCLSVTNLLLGCGTLSAWFVILSLFLTLFLSLPLSPPPLTLPSFPLSFPPIFLSLVVLSPHLPFFLDCRGPQSSLQWTWLRPDLCTFILIRDLMLHGHTQTSAASLTPSSSARGA